MKIGFIGLGKLGMPCAVAISMNGHNVMGTDINNNKMNVIEKNNNTTK